MLQKHIETKSNNSEVIILNLKTTRPIFGSQLDPMNRDPKHSLEFFDFSMITSLLWLFFQVSLLARKWVFRQIKNILKTALSQKYKPEGYIFKCNKHFHFRLFYEGFTYTIFFRFIPSPPASWTTKHSMFWGKPDKQQHAIIQALVVHAHSHFRTASS